MEKIQLKVSGMSCGHCEKAIVNALLDLGAVNPTANKDSGLVTAEFDPTKLSAGEIKNEIAEIGYEII